MQTSDSLSVSSNGFFTPKAIEDGRLSRGIYQGILENQFYKTQSSERIRYDKLTLPQTIEKMKLFTQWFPFFSQSKEYWPTFNTIGKKIQGRFVSLIVTAEEFLRESLIANVCSLENKKCIENTENIFKALTDRLKQALSDGKQEEVKALMDLCNIDSIGNDGKTALSWAVLKKVI